MTLPQIGMDIGSIFFKAVITGGDPDWPTQVYRPHHGNTLEVFRQEVAPLLQQRPHGGHRLGLLGSSSHVHVLLRVLFEVVQHLGAACVVARIGEARDDDRVPGSEPGVGHIAERLVGAIEEPREAAALDRGRHREARQAGSLQLRASASSRWWKTLPLERVV